MFAYDPPKMSPDMVTGRVCCVHCNFCNTILAVNVPCSNIFTAFVTVRCGHCTNLLSVNVGSLLQPVHLQDFQIQKQQSVAEASYYYKGGASSSSKCSKYPQLDMAPEHDSPRTTPIRPPEKKQRVPSAYNRFIKEEIQRIKATNPDITHREAFSTAAKNWAHFPHLHFGVNLDGNKHPKPNQAVPGESGARQKSIGFY